MAFEFDGKKYSKASAHQRGWGERLIKEIDLSGGERILDLGCGDGALTARLAELVPEGSVLGVDASKGMVDAAREHKHPNLSFRRADIEHIDFKSEFDVIFSNATLHWVKDHKSLLANVYIALKDDGLMRFNFAADGNCSSFFRVVKEVMRLGKYAAYFAQFEWPWYMPRPPEYKNLVKRLPFVGARVWGEKADRHFPSEEALTCWVDQPCIVPFLGCVKGKDKKPFRDEVCRRMVKATARDDGTFFETFRRVNVSARK